MTTIMGILHLDDFLINKRYNLYEDTEEQKMNKKTVDKILSRLDVNEICSI